MRPQRTLPRRLLLVAATQEGLVNKAQCDAAGLDKHAVARLIRYGFWIRVTRCVYDTDAEPVERRRRGDYHDHLRRRAAWVGLLATPNGIATGACALALHGVDGLPTDLVPEVARPGGMYSALGEGIVVRRYQSFPDESYRGRRIAAVVDALAQALPNMARDRGIATLSNALHAGHLDEAGLRRVQVLVRGRRGAARVRGWFGLSDGRDASPAETFARLSCIDHGVPPDGQQVSILSDGVFLARVDFVWSLPAGRFAVVEIDGRAFHSGGAMLADDALRQNGLVGTDRLVVLRFPAVRALTADGPGYGLGAEIAERLDQLGWRPGSRIGSQIELAD